jgi:CarboxypepD_reg-like domain/Gram-negative bacterial TonB protein C-terminal
MGKEILNYVSKRKMKRRNEKSRVPDLIRYIRGEMTKKEENAFQRELQRDPFAEDAAEGLSQISAEEAETDLCALEKRLKTRVSGRQRIIYYRIAASIAALMIISSVFIIINRNRPAAGIAKTGGVRSPAEVAESTVIKQPEEIALQYKLAEAEKKEVQPPEEVGVQKFAENAGGQGQIVGGQEQQAAGAVKTDNTAAPAAAEPHLIAAEDQMAVRASVTSLKKPLQPEVSGTVISSEDNLPIPGAVVSLKGTKTRVITDTKGNFIIPLSDTVRPVLVAGFIGMESREVPAKEEANMKISLTPTAMALNEVEVVDYGKASEEMTKGAIEKEENAEYSPAQPVTGKEDFDKYIEENLRKPASLPSGQRAVVVLNFVVKSDGTIDSLKAVRTPGPEFSEEAIRLIRSGPSWKPAVESGQTINEDVRIRIVFK